MPAYAPLRRLTPAWLLIALLCTWPVAPGNAAAVPAAPKRVLVLVPFQTSRPSIVALLRGMEEGLRASYPGKVEVVAESIAAIPPDPEEYAARVDDWLAYKYGHQKFDSIVAVLSPAVPHVERLRDRFWPDAPVLLVLQEEERRLFPQSLRRSARIVTALSNTDTLRSALQLLPDTRHLVYLAGASAQDRRANALVLGNIRQAYPRLDIIEIEGLSWEETKTRVKALPEKSIILIGSFLFDKDDREFNVPQLAEGMSATANAPIFADSDIGIGNGTVGGLVLSVKAAGVTAGDELAELLRGADPGALPVREVKNSCIVDWRQLRRWDIPESRLPADATILYRPPSAWEQYKGYITAVAVVLAALLTLVTFLLIERQRRRKEEKLNTAMLQSLPGLALLVDRDGVVLRTNQADALSGDTDTAKPPPAAVGCRYQDWLRGVLAPADGAQVLPMIDEVIAGARAIVTAEAALSSGAEWIEIRAIQLLKPQTGTLVVHLGITQRKQAELERTRSRTEIYHLNRVAAMGQLAASLAHELSQPLTAIMSNAEAAQRFAGRPDPDMLEIREALDDITRDDKRARAVIQGMRAMLKKEYVVVELVDLNEVAVSVAQMIRNEATLRGMRIELSLNPSAVMVKGDQVGLQQVVLNLASNGLDAMAGTSAERCLTIRTAVEPNAGTISVVDNGPGVSLEVRDKLFQPFFTTKRTGLGMGLSICQSILESLGGRIELENHDGKGASFLVALPLA